MLASFSQGEMEWKKWTNKALTNGANVKERFSLLLSPKRLRGKGRLD